jgi:hypothetical protein
MDLDCLVNTIKTYGIKQMNDGPLSTAFNSDPTGIIRQTLTTYRRTKQGIHRERVERVYTKDGSDYVDSVSSVPLYLTDPT